MRRRGGTDSMMEKYEAYLRRKRREEEDAPPAETPEAARPQLDTRAAQETGLRPEDVEPAPTPPSPPRAPASGRPATPIRRPVVPARPGRPTGQKMPVAAADPWDALAEIPLDPRHLARQRIISATRKDPAHVAFDVLRTRLLAALRDNGWRRVAITSPTQNCGKTFVAANLGISLSRQDGCRTILMDMDLRRPSLAQVMGARVPGTLSAVLTGDRALADHLVVPAENDLKIGRRLALGLNGRAESYASELLQGPTTPRVLSGMIETYDPDVVLYDLPPALYYDDVIAFREQFDGVLLVIGGGITRPREVHDVKRRLGEDTPLLGVIMNKAEGLSIADYSY
ncbi:exopolysaccharide biosynthesis protein [Aquicoccus sp. SCR17]|nr:exopolysaccharide biosynthesis protein [Carideicomes alvinocaridis]